MLIIKQNLQIFILVCATCDKGGEREQNNCILCESNYIKKPDIPNSKDCALKCQYFYYYTKYNQYKCTTYPQGPQDYSLFIKEKGKFIDNWTMIYINIMGIVKKNVQMIP